MDEELQECSVETGGFPPTGAIPELESLRKEYTNTFDRSNKLDNKVYIIITFCGFLFVFITSLFSGLSQYHFNGSPLHTTLTVISLICCVAVVITYVFVLVWFLKLLIPEQLKRMDPDLLRSAELESMTGADACTKLIRMYREVINHNLDRLHARCDCLNQGLRYVVVTCILSFLAYTLQLLIHMV